MVTLNCIHIEIQLHCGLGECKNLCDLIYNYGEFGFGV